MESLKDMQSFPEKKAEKRSEKKKGGGQGDKQKNKLENVWLKPSHVDKHINVND